MLSIDSKVKIVSKNHDHPCTSYAIGKIIAEDHLGYEVWITESHPCENCKRRHTWMSATGSFPVFGVMKAEYAGNHPIHEIIELS